MIAVCELRSPSMGEFLWGLESSGWLKHVKTILDAGIFIAKAVSEEGASVLVHCSDGWDRTAQVCSVSSLLLDPYYRTIRGFMVLIEKDWISFGHKFNHRIQERTYSLWSYLWKQRLDYMNPLYRADHSQTQGTLRPHTTPCHFRFWRGLYNRFEKGMHPRQSVTDFLQAVKEETQQLEEEMEFMEKVW
ncbi:phosphatidylinositol-3-phosphate phosphatase MTMR7-like [Phyllobates terribilis]|uniref:phosphatidylinositol-3-phosphate phosphatase MTMR7-like n=1 Tax=Phyllobates terribilis TaxID=111132 RepID=UPI003CCB693B